MKVTKKARKLKNGMNAITKLNFKAGFKLPIYSGKEGHMEGGKLLPAYSKIRRGTPYVNPNNFGIV